ncbi:hypothetical protein OHB12_10040 [Nocardia sp. NBC_01730]|uniref:hypothetical protein n=1 Tax=Nocardia sp. NBC_01730 TaxID=2975998 RepID=UPI002E14625A|nr:hypothetical protein OHB12_10040 [Nocardia sp. NBC_01730]
MAHGTVSNERDPDELLVLPLPQLLPRKRSELESAARTVMDSSLAPGRMHDDARTFAIAAKRCLARYCGDLADNPTNIAEPTGEDFTGHDSFFAVIRVSTKPEVALLAGAALSHARILTDLTEMGTTLSLDQVRELLDGYAAICRYAGMRSNADHGRPRTDFGYLVSGGGYRPATRWRLGHQHFFVQLQSLVTALNLLSSAVVGEDEPGIREALQLATLLALSASAGMRFAADFHACDYHSVRGSMSPPRVAAGFSGLQTRDHHALVQAFQTLPLGVLRSFPAEYETFLTAVGSVYTAHVHVCEFFGDGDGPSLRMQTRAAGPHRLSGAAVAEALAHSRLRILDPAEDSNGA